MFSIKAIQFLLQKGLISKQKFNMLCIQVFFFIYIALLFHPVKEESVVMEEEEVLSSYGLKQTSRHQMMWLRDNR